MKSLKDTFSTALHNPIPGAREFFKYIGPGLIVTVGFIDPGNWASNMAAGSGYGYKLLWMVTLSTIMLIILQHNAAHLGIATGECLSEAATRHMRPWLSRALLATAVVASMSTALAEILGGAIALNLLFKIPLKLASLLVLVFIIIMLFTNSYKKLERWIIGFVSIIGFSYLYELAMSGIQWPAAVSGWVAVSFPKGSMPVIMAVLGAVVMPHNLFLHSEVIQSREWNKQDEAVIKKQLKYEFADTLFSMLLGWAINSAMIILAAAAFYANGKSVTELGQAQQLLEPLLGKGSAVVFGIALLFAGVSSSMTAGMAGGSIVAGMFGEPYNIKDIHSKVGVVAILAAATAAIFVVADPFKGLIYSQMLLSMQLPLTIFLQIYLTSSEKVMGKYKNSVANNVMLLVIGAAVTILNIMLLISFIRG